MLSHNNISAGHTSLLQVYRRLVWPKYCSEKAIHVVIISFTVVYWTSRCLVLNILARRDLFSTERSNVQHQQDLRPRFLQLISDFVSDACRHIERRTEKVNQFCKKLLNSWVIQWSMTSRVCFGYFFSWLNLGQFTKKRNKLHISFFI